jgi:hypothetical protein
LEQLLHVFAFLCKHPKLTLYMSPELPRLDFGEFRTKQDDFTEIHRDAKEQLPHTMPAPRGMGVTTTALSTLPMRRIKIRGGPIPVM